MGKEDTMAGSYTNLREREESITVGSNTDLLKTAGDPCRKTGYPGEQETSQKERGYGIRKKVKGEYVEGISRPERIDNPETEGNKKYDQNKVRSKIRKLKTITSVGLAMGKMMSKTDEKSIEPGQWITDKIITLAIQNMRGNQEINRVIEERVTIIDPCVAHLIRIINSIETSRELVSDTGLREKTIACIPINNRNEQENRKGSHWSLLVWKKDRRRGKFLHYDPIRSMNTGVAKEMVNKLKRLDGATFEANKREVDCPRQRNNYDCGIYVILMIEKIIRNLKEDKCIETIGITQEEVDGKREELKNKIRKNKEISTQVKVVEDEEKNEAYIKELGKRVGKYPTVDKITLDNEKEGSLLDIKRTEEEAKEIHKMTEKLLKKEKVVNKTLKKTKRKNQKK